MDNCADFLDGHLQATVTNEEDDTAWSVHLPTSSKDTKDTTNSISNAPIEYLRMEITVRWERHVKESELRCADFGNNAVVWF